MAEKKFERRTTLDPAVADLLSGMQQRQAESQLPRKERERLGKHGVQGFILGRMGKIIDDHEAPSCSAS